MKLTIIIALLLNASLSLAQTTASSKRPEGGSGSVGSGSGGLILSGNSSCTSCSPGAGEFNETLAEAAFTSGQKPNLDDLMGSKWLLVGEIDLRVLKREFDLTGIQQQMYNSTKTYHYGLTFKPSSFFENAFNAVNTAIFDDDGHISDIDANPATLSLSENALCYSVFMRDGDTRTKTKSQFEKQCRVIDEHHTKMICKSTLRVDPSEFNYVSNDDKNFNNKVVYYNSYLKK